MVGSVLHFPPAEHMAYVEEVSNRGAAEVAAMEVPREAKSTLKQAWEHSAVDERANARTCDAIPTPNNRLARVVGDIARQLIL